MEIKASETEGSADVFWEEITFAVSRLQREYDRLQKVTNSEASVGVDIMSSVRIHVLIVKYDIVTRRETLKDT
jgi:hypothetical protein